MDRDMRLTGVFRAQSDNPEAPLGFELNNPWKVYHQAIAKQISVLIHVADGGPHFLNCTSLPKVTVQHCEDLYIFCHDVGVRMKIQDLFQ
jgi:hypothetical protein